MSDDDARVIRMSADEIERWRSLDDGSREVAHALGDVVIVPTSPG